MSIEYENPWFQIVKNGKYHYLRENGANNGAVILAIVDEHFVFVKVHRPAHGKAFIEAPRGYGDSGETSELCAIRELYEETGYSFDVSALNPLGVVCPNSAILASSIPVFLIEAAQQVREEVDSDEVSELCFIPKNEIHNYVALGKITDGITLSALSLYWANSNAN